MSLRTTAGRSLLRLYPLGWQRRYGEEMAALVEDDPPSALGLATLLTGALRAHARPGPWRVHSSPAERARLSLSAAFACWVAISIAGASFQKETEDGRFTYAASQHGVLEIARTSVIAGAALGAAAIAVGGVPLLWQALRQARSPTAATALRRGLLLPLAGLALFAAVTAALLAVTPASVQGTSTALRLALVVPWWAAGGALALSWALAPRVVLRHLDASPSSLRRAGAAGVVLVAAMALVTLGLAAYCIALIRSEPSLAAQSGGPLWPSTALVLAGGVALAALGTALGGVSASRALSASRA